MSRPSVAWGGLTRAGLAVVAGAGIVYASATLPGVTSLSPAADTAAASTPQQVSVTSSSLTCPGPETEGLAGVAAVPGTTTVYAASAPAAALDGVTLPAEAGALSVLTQAAGTVLVTSDQRGARVEAAAAGAISPAVQGEAALAPAVAALQTTLVAAGDERAQVAAACGTPKADLWFVAGGGQSTRRERVVLSNPGGNTVSAEVTILGGGGVLPSAAGHTVTVPPHGRTSVLVDALVGPENTPVVHVVATGGVLFGVLEDSWIDGAVGRGADDAVPTADPANEQVIPAVIVDGPARLRVAVPGTDETVVQARLLTADGPTPLPDDGVLRVPGGSVREIDLGSVPAGSYAIEVKADHPVVAGAMTERRGDGTGLSDFGWTAGSAPIDVIAGTPLPDNATARLTLVATGDAASATVVTQSADGEQSTTYSVPADSVTTVDVSGKRAVWVRHTGGTLRAGVGFNLGGSPTEPLYSAVPLGPLVVSATQVPVQQVSR